MALLIRRHTRQLLSLVAFALLFASCEKALDNPKDEGHPILYGYYQESKGLNKDAVDIDSVCRFSDKVYDYVYFNPDCVSTSYFSRIEYNISQRLGDLGITFEGSRWDGTTVIDFNF